MELIPLLKLNDTFGSYKEFRNAVDKYEKVNRVQFYTSDAKRLHRASAATYEIVKSYPELEYCSAKLSCVYGGKALVRKKNFENKTQKTKGSFKQGCKAEIFINLTDSRDKLIITRINEKHNHDIPTADVIKQLKRVRKCTERSRLTKKRMSLKQFNDRLLKSEGISVENLVKTNSLSRSKNFEKISRNLTERYQCTVDLRSDDDGKIYGLFFQDEYMRKCYQLFPEFLTVDCTHRLENINSWIYLLSSENSLGSNSVVGVAVVTVRDKASSDWILERFKKRNRESASVSVIMTDRQSCEFEISRLFPTSEIAICSSHALYTLRKEIRDLKMVKSEDQQCCEFFRRLLEAENHEEFKMILEDMEDSVPYSFSRYYYEKWHRFRSHWVRNFCKSRSFIRNKLEDPNSPFRSGLNSCKTLVMLIDDLFRHLHRQRDFLKRDMSKMIQKTYSGGNPVDAGRSYDEVLTSHAYGKIEYSLYVAENQSSSEHFHTENNETVYQTKDNSFLVSEFSCMCDFFTVLRLPCEHILAYRKLHDMDLFAEYLFSKRWTRERLRQLLSCEIEDIDDGKKKTTVEKFSEVEPVCWELAALCTGVSTREFHRRLALLNQVKASWGNEDRVVLQTVEYAQLEVACGSDMEVEDEDWPTEEIILEVIN